MLAAIGVLLLPLVLACSPQVEIHTRIDLPSGITNSKADHLHITAATSSKIGPLPPPPTGFWSPMKGHLMIRDDSNSFLVELIVRERRVYVNLTAWYDTNGNGVVDAGDAVGVLGPDPIFCEDHGMFSNNVTVTTPIALKTVL